MEAKELRDRIIEGYKELDWSMDEISEKEWTDRTLDEIFGVIGRDLGFEIEQEKKPKEFLYDQVWVKKIPGTKNKIIVGAIESENSIKSENRGFDLVFDDEFTKLLAFNGKYRILIYYCKWDNVKDDFNRFNEYFQKYPFIRDEDSLIIITCDLWDKGWKIGLFQKGKEIDTEEFFVV